MTSGLETPSSTASVVSAPAINGNNPNNPNPPVNGGGTSPTPTPPLTGWTTFTPSADTHIIYVNSAGGTCETYSTTDPEVGADAFHPVGPLSKACGTITAALALMRDGYPDWMLFRKGDTFNNQVFGDWHYSGRSETEPMLISSYGSSTERPLINTGTLGVLDLNGHVSNYIAFVGLHFNPVAYDGYSANCYAGFRWVGSSTYVLFEDNMIERYCGGNLVFDDYPDGTRFRNIIIRRNVISKAFTRYVGFDQRPSGLYFSSSDGVLIEENVFDRNGWIEEDPTTAPDWFRHQIYGQNGNTGVILRRNIFGGPADTQMRSGGLAEDNLFLHATTALTFGMGAAPELNPNGVTGAVRNNVMLDGANIGSAPYGNAQGPRGMALTLGNIAQATVENNIAAHNVHGDMPWAVNFDHVNANGVSRGVENTFFQNNIIFDWGTPAGNPWSNEAMRFVGGAVYVNLQILNNSIQYLTGQDYIAVHDDLLTTTSGVTSANNQFWSLQSQNSWMLNHGPSISFDAWKALTSDTTSVALQTSFPDPSRDLASYQTSIGATPGLNNFMDQARLQSKDNWRQEYTAPVINNYIRAGFGR